MSIFERKRAGGVIPISDPAWAEVWEIVNQTIAHSAKLNASGNVDDIRAILSEILGQNIDPSTTVLAPFRPILVSIQRLGKTFSLTTDVRF